MHKPKVTAAFVALILAGLHLGPSATGQESTRPLPEQLALQVIGLDGKTVNSETIYICYQTRKSHHFEQLRTDSRGTLELLCPEEFQGGAKGTVVIQRAAWPEDDAEIPTAYLGAKELTFSQLADSWKIQLEKPALLVSGRVVDRQGEDLEGVEVSVRADVIGRRLNPRARLSVVMHHHTVMTTDGGRFAIHQNKTRVRDLRVKLKKDGFAALPHARLTVGTRNTELIMAKCETVYGQVSGVPNGMRPFLPFRLAPHDITLKTCEPYFDMKNGKLRFDQVIVGTYDFELMASRGPNANVLLTVPNITIKPGETCRDTRLAAIDISHLYRWIRLRLVDHRGKPLTRTRVLIQTGLNRSTQTVNGTRDLWKMVPAKDSKIEIKADGYRPMKISTPAGREITVSLSQGWNLALAVSNLPILRIAQLHVKVSKIGQKPIGRFPNQARPVHALIDNITRKGSLAISSPGKYTVQLLALPRKNVDPDRMPQAMFQPGARVGEHIILATRNVRIPEDQDTSKAIPMLITLTPTEFAVLKSFDIVLEER